MLLLWILLATLAGGLIAISIASWLAYRVFAKYLHHMVSLSVGVLLFCFNTRCAYLPVRADTMLPGEPSYHWRAHDGIRLIATENLVGAARLWAGPAKVLPPLR